MGSAKSEYNFQETGKQVRYDASTFEVYDIAAPQVVYDDFIGSDVVIPAAGSPESGCKWVKKIVGAAPPTLAKTGDGVNGLVACSLTADSQKQDADLYMNDELMCSIAQGAIMEVRAAFTTLPTLNGIGQIGLYGAWADGGSAYRVGFEVTAGGVVNCESDDAVTDTSASAATTLVAGTYYIFRIDCTTQTDIKFYINGARVASGTTFANAASAANSKCQPHCGMYKVSGAGLGVLSVDYVKVWQDRA